MRPCFALVLAMTPLACGSTTTVTDDAGSSGDGAVEPFDGMSSSEAEASTSSCSPNAVAFGVGAPLGASCIPRAEQNAMFSGFDYQEVSLETATASCASGTCLINHFQGRVTCPEGQGAGGQGVDAGPCLTPCTGDPVTESVPAQCAARPAAQAVYCSCRCANVDGRTDDGATYCACPSTMSCVQLITVIGPPGGAADSIAGAYCIEVGTEYDAGLSCP